MRKKAPRRDKRTEGVRGEGSAGSEVTERTPRWRGSSRVWAKVKGLRAHSFTPAWWPGVTPSPEVRSPLWSGRLERLLDLGPSSALLPRSHSVADLRPPRSGPPLPKWGKNLEMALCRPPPVLRVLRDKLTEWGHL